jgi:hypothetical protein
MRKLQLTSALVMLLSTIGIMRSAGQNTPSPKLEFSNTPVLFKDGNKSFQQVLASYRSGNPGIIIITREGKDILKTNLINGTNRFLLTIPAVTKPTKTTFSAKIDNGVAQTYPLTLVPPKKWEIYFVQHAHTDIGYTRPQSEILAEHLRYIDYALDYCDQTDSLPDDSKFRWT